jgi:hypothetical protein
MSEGSVDAADRGPRPEPPSVKGTRNDGSDFFVTHNATSITVQWATEDGFETAELKYDGPSQFIEKLNAAKSMPDDIRAQFESAADVHMVWQKATHDHRAYVVAFAKYVADLRSGLSPVMPEKPEYKDLSGRPLTPELFVSEHGNLLPGGRDYSEGSARETQTLHGLLDEESSIEFANLMSRTERAIYEALVVTNAPIVVGVAAEAAIVALEPIIYTVMERYITSELFALGVNTAVGVIAAPGTPSIPYPYSDQFNNTWKKLAAEVIELRDDIKDLLEAAHTNDDVDRDALDDEQDTLGDEPDMSSVDDEAGLPDDGADLISTADNMESSAGDPTTDDADGPDGGSVSTSSPDDDYPSYENTSEFDYSDLEASSEAEADEFPAYESGSDDFSDEGQEGEDVDVEEQGPAIE